MKTIIVVGALVIGALAGCGAREHIYPTFGQKNHAFFRQQHVYPELAKGAPSGLDSEEAAAINKSYRKTLGIEEPRAEPPQVLMIQPTKPER